MYGELLRWSNNMNILYILGNGFDINLGLKTRYSDFYQYYLSLESKNEDVVKLKENIRGNNWSDLELALGEYSSNVGSAEVFIDIVEDIIENLADYIEEQEKIIEELEIDYEKFFKYLSYPEKSLTIVQENEIKQFVSNWKNKNLNLFILSFNYTNTFELMIEDLRTIKKNYYNYPVIYKGINHVHGFHDKNMVLGVNDISQVLNEKIRDDVELRRTFIKNDCNQAMEHAVEKDCEIRISEANLICVFGSSLGQTDKIWWDMIGKRLLYGGTKLIIFDYDRDIIFTDRRPNKKISYREKIIEKFLNNTSLTDEEKEVVKCKILVGINTDMFSKILIKEK